MSQEQVLNEEMAWMFGVYANLSDIIKSESAKAVLDDMMHYYPKTYELLEAEFERRRKIRELGALLVNSV
jgi:hypothetical protein